MYETHEWKLALKEFAVNLISKFTAIGIMIFVVIWVVSGITPLQLFDAIVLQQPIH